MNRAQFAQRFIDDEKAFQTTDLEMLEGNRPANRGDRDAFQESFESSDGLFRRALQAGQPPFLNGSRAIKGSLSDFVTAQLRKEPRRPSGKSALIEKSCPSLWSLMYDVARP